MPKVQLISGIYLAAPRADAALSGSCGKLEQAGCGFDPWTLIGYSNGLSQVFARTKKKVEKLFDVRALLAGVTLTSKTNNVQARDAVGAHGRAKMGDIFAKTTIALDHTGITDADELMKDSPPANKGVISQANVPGQHAAVGQDVLIPDLHIMGEMDTNHKKVSVTQRRGAARLTAAMNGDMLANDVFSADDNSAVCLRGKAKILWVSADDGGTPNDTLWTNVDLSDDLCVGFDPATCGDFDRSVNDDVRAYFDADIDLGRRVNDSS